MLRYSGTWIRRAYPVLTVLRRNVNKKARPRYGNRKKKKKRAATVHLLGVHRISAVLHFWYPFSAHMMHHETLIGGREGVRWPLMTASRALGGFQEHLRPRGWARDVTTQCTLTRRGRTPTLYALSVPPPPKICSVSALPLTNTRDPLRSEDFNRKTWQLKKGTRHTPFQLQKSWYLEGNIMQPVLFYRLVCHMNECNHFQALGLGDEESNKRNGSRLSADCVERK